MKYFNGFSLKGEEVFFSEELIESNYTVAGFSYGTQKALEYAYNCTNRIDRLILISPAFFQNHKKSFIKTQLRYFKADKEAYKKEFLKNVSYPSSNFLDEYISEGTYEELHDLLSYVWEEEKIQELINRGIKIEVFMGDADKIVDAKKSFEFFSKLVPVYLFKGKGHLLK
jgi:esterase/lipase